MKIFNAVSEEAKKTVANVVAMNTVVAERRKQLEADLEKLGAYKLVTAGGGMVVCAAAFAGAAPSGWLPVDPRLLDNPTMTFHRPKEGSDWDRRFNAASMPLLNIEGVKNFAYSEDAKGVKISVARVAEKNGQYYLHSPVDIDALPGFAPVVSPKLGAERKNLITPRPN